MSSSVRFERVVAAAAAAADGRGGVVLAAGRPSVRYCQGGDLPRKCAEVTVMSRRPRSFN